MSAGMEQFLSGDRTRWSYLYSYPHKTAYRRFDDPISLRDLWADEPKDSLYLYTHIPFCASKCSFCNLFSLSRPGQDLVDRYLDRLETQAHAVRAAIGPAKYSGYAIGGGTPSLLEVPRLERLFFIQSTVFGVDPSHAGSIEASPDTLTMEQIQYLSSVGLERLSLGVQTFDPAEARMLGRPRPDRALDALLEAVAKADFPVFNLDLIYGTAGQTPESFRASLEKAVSFSPQEIFLYPLYVRPLTPLHRRGSGPDLEGERMDSLLEVGRQFLVDQGYEQDSLRLFRRKDLWREDAIEYSCQEDGMVGLGVGARSYTRDVHYSTEWAVDRTAVEAVLDSYLARSPESFAQADHGIRLSLNDRKRRFVIKSILKARGLDLSRYAQVFGSLAQSDYPDLLEMERLGLAEGSEGWLRLTRRGMALSDGIGAWWIGPEVAARMNEYELR